MQVMHARRKENWRDVEETLKQLAREGHPLGLVVRGEQLAGLSGIAGMQVGGIGTLLAESETLELCYARQATSEEGMAKCDRYCA